MILLASQRKEAIKRRAAGETLAEIAKSYAVDLSRATTQAREVSRREMTDIEERLVRQSTDAVQQYRSAIISRRTKDALAAAKARGVKLGGLRDHGRELQQAAIERAKALAPLFDELAGLSHRALAAELNARKVSPPAGGQWHGITVKRVRERLAG